MFLLCKAMKKFLILTLIISALLPSCKTIEEEAAPVVMEPVVVESVEVRTEKALPAVEEAPEPEVEEEDLHPVVVEEVPEIAEPVVEPEPMKEPESIKEAFIQTEEKIETPDKVLTGKALVDEISEKDKVKEESKVETPAPEPKLDAPAVAEEPEVKDAEIPETVEIPEVPEVPEVEKPRVEVVEVAPEVEEKSIFDSEMDGKVLSIAIELISIMVIFALSSVIRNKYARPLSVGLSFLLAILFTAIPMLISFILFGWSNLHLIYLVLIFTVFIFSSQRGH